MSTTAFNTGSERSKRRVNAPATCTVNTAIAAHAAGPLKPATCEHSYASPEIEFMQAMQDYKQASGRMFPTWSEVLEVLRSLGYQKEGCNRMPSA